MADSSKYRHKDPEKPPVECVCPGCKRTHIKNLIWIGKTKPWKWCPSCETKDDLSDRSYSTHAESFKVPPVVTLCPIGPCTLSSPDVLDMLCAANKKRAREINAFVYGACLKCKAPPDTIQFISMKRKKRKPARKQDPKGLTSRKGSGRKKK